MIELLMEFKTFLCNHKKNHTETENPELSNCKHRFVACRDNNVMHRHILKKKKNIINQYRNPFNISYIAIRLMFSI